MLTVTCYWWQGWNPDLLTLNFWYCNWLTAYYCLSSSLQHCLNMCNCHNTRLLEYKARAWRPWEVFMLHELLRALFHLGAIFTTTTTLKQLSCLLRMCDCFYRSWSELAGENDNISNFSIVCHISPRVDCSEGDFVQRREHSILQTWFISISLGAKRHPQSSPF